MSAANGSAVPGETVTDAKGKGKALDQVQGQDMSMDEDEDSSEGEESGNEPPRDPAPTTERYRTAKQITNTSRAMFLVEEEADEDNMEEIDTSNILGRRTRGKNIDFVEAAQKAQEAGDTLEDDDEDEDEDFDVGEQADGDKMEE